MTKNEKKTRSRSKEKHLHDAAGSSERKYVPPHETEDVDTEKMMERLGRPSCVRWVPTSELELYHSEVAMLSRIRPYICQRSIAGLNTIATVHEKVRSVKHTEEGETSEGNDGESAVATVKMHSAMPVQRQQVKPQPIDADMYDSIVCVHGFGGGVGNWLPPWRAMAEQNDVYAFDLPGFARSERPKHVSFPNADSALDWFMDYFVKWFEAMQLGIEAGAGSSDSEGSKGRKKDASISQQRPLGRRIVLVGHSFGGYLCSIFAARYPHFVDQLILVDPWGVPRYVPPEKNSKEYERLNSVRFRIARSIYNSVGAGGALRCLGPFGTNLLAKVRPDFGARWEPHIDDPQHFYQYTYHCNAAPYRVGEKGFAALGITPLAPHYPLIDHVSKFPKSSLSVKDTASARASVYSAVDEGEAMKTVAAFDSDRTNQNAPASVEAANALLSPSRLSKVLVLFGDNSWMMSPFVPQLIDAFNAHGMPATLWIIKNAGHQVPSDNAEEFARVVLAWMQS